MSGREGIDWQDVRREYPYLGEQIYLNAAGMSPLSRSSRDAGVAVLERMCGDTKAFAESLFIENVIAHQHIGGFYNVSANDVAVVPTSSMAMNLLAIHTKRCYPNKNKIVTLADEFPSSTLPWLSQGFELISVKPGSDNRYDLGEILSKVDNDSIAAVVTSYVQFSTGFRLDVDALGTELAAFDLAFIVNATQAAGAIPIDLAKLPIDAMVVSGNKWMMAGVGAATLYVSEELRQSHFPPVAGWMSTIPVSFTENAVLNANNATHSVELGLNSLVPTKALEASIKYLQQLGMDLIHQRVMSLSNHLMDLLKEKGADVVTPPKAEDRLGIVSVKRSDAENWCQELRQEKIIVVPRGSDVVRISPHIYNSKEDIEMLIGCWAMS